MGVVVNEGGANDTWLASNIMDIISVIANIALAIWVVARLQNRQSQSRFLKDYLISELKDLRDDYVKMISELENGTVLANTILSRFKLLNIRADAQINLASEKFKAEIGTLLPYQIDLVDIISNDHRFGLYMRFSRPFKLSPETERELMNFQQRHARVIHDLIIYINSK